MESIIIGLLIASVICGNDELLPFYTHKELQGNFDFFISFNSETYNRRAKVVTMDH